MTAGESSGMDIEVYKYWKLCSMYKSTMRSEMAHSFL